MATSTKAAKSRNRCSPVVWCVLIGTTAVAVWVAYLGFTAMRWVAIDFQVFSRWDNHTVTADEAMVDGVLLPAIEAYARREGQLPADLDALVAAGDLGAVPASQAGVWMYRVGPEGFTIGVGDTRTSTRARIA